MNKVILMGRLTRDPEIRYSNSGSSAGPMAIARFSLAVDRRFKRQGDSAEADFFNCTAFGRQAEFVEKYFGKGSKALVTGRIQNDNYTNREGQKVYSVQIMVEDIEFCESKNAAAGGGSFNNAGSFAPADRPSPAKAAPAGDGFMNIPDGVDDEELPFN